MVHYSIIAVVNLSIIQLPLAVLFLEKNILIVQDKNKSAERKEVYV